LRSRLHARTELHMPIFRRDQEQDHEHQRSIRDAMARSLEILRRAVRPDTFLGRKTHDPFPEEKDE
jgi:hypothetical protein